MRFNTKVRYGVRVMLEIALKASINEGVYQHQIAESQDISFKYLDKIISDLKKAKLIKNIKGRNTGYILTKSTSQITLLDIYQAFENEIAIVDCLQVGCPCNRKTKCATSLFWGNLNSQIIDSMAAKSLSSLIEDHKKINAH